MAFSIEFRLFFLFDADKTMLYVQWDDQKYKITDLIAADVVWIN